MCDEIDGEPAIEWNKGQLGSFKNRPRDDVACLHSSVGKSDVFCVDRDYRNSGEMSNFGKSSPRTNLLPFNYMLLCRVI